jgi:imidazolonepropionase
MTGTLFFNIGQLVTNDFSVDGTQLGIVENAAMLIDDGKVSWVGSNSLAPINDVENQVDVRGQALIPGFVDSHTHMVFAGDRSQEFRARMQGESYSSGGIMSTVERTRAASDAELTLNAQALFAEAHSSGSTTLECKSGYGLTVEEERRSLMIAKSLTIETTFLGAHVVPAEHKMKPADYVELVTGQMLDAVLPYSKWIDVFCDRGAFSAEDARTILKAGMAKGLLPRLHANQLEQGEGIALGVELGAASVDHVTHFNDNDIELLSESSTVATLLPGAEFSTRSVYPDARRLLEANVAVALASDCNPGSSYTTNMSFVLALAVRDMHFSPEQALWSATLGGAKALRRTDVGHLQVGAAADFVVLKERLYIHLAYRPGVDLIEQVWRSGIKIK